MLELLDFVLNFFTCLLLYLEFLTLACLPLLKLCISVNWAALDLFFLNETGLGCLVGLVA